MNCDFVGCYRIFGVCFGLCKFGYYNLICFGVCSLYCRNGICECFNGICFECEVGYYGFFCNLICSKCDS